MSATDLLIVGAGAKAAAIATKVHVLNGLGLGPISLEIVEGTEPAASWLGRNGMTSGEEPLAVTPIKDIGFPYQSHREFGEAGEAIDAATMAFSWQRYLIGERRYARWIDAGSPSVRHRDYGAYLAWVLSRATAGVAHVHGRVAEVGLDEDGERWLVEVEEPGGSSRHAAGALVLTGPGTHRSFPHEPGVAARVFHCDSRREEFARLPADRECDVAVVGGGESALSCVMFLRGLRPRSRFTVYTPMLPMSRGESFLENRVFSNPDEVEWGALDLSTRRDFVKHSDRGVFDPPSLAAIAYDERCRFVTGRVTDVGAAAGGGGVRLQYKSPQGAAGSEHEFVVNCTGFDLLAQLRGLFPAPLRAEVERRAGPLWERPAGSEVRIGRALELVGMSPRLHIPGLGGLSQGPGFANLGALGLLSNRVLQPLLRAAAILLLAVAVLSGCGSSSSAGGLELTGSGYPGVDVANTREAKGSIDSSNVSELEEAWALPLTAQSSYGAHSSAPVIVNGVVYSQDLESNVQAIALESGDVLWTRRYEEPDQGPNGVVVAGGMVFGATAKAAFALDQKTGKQIWSVPLTVNYGEAIDMAPGYHDGLVYVSTVPTLVDSSYPGGGVGTLWALDAASGRKKWRFDTVPTDLWGDPKVNSGGGLWQPPSFDEEGSIYFGTGNPAPAPGTPQEPWGSSRPGSNLYTDSIVKLDAKTGKMLWHFQLTPHDLYDWDFQDPPILIAAGGRELAIGAGKSGIVVALDAKTGKPVWKRPVGTHNGHDDDGLLALRGESSKIEPGTVYPGTLGGVIAPMATDGKTVFVPVVNHPLTISGGGELGESDEMTGELVAIDAATGKISWNQEFASAAFGAPTVVNDLVFATSAEGSVFAFETGSGNEVWTAALPAGINTSVSIAGDTVVAPAGLAAAEGQKPGIVAFRLGG